MYPPCTGVGVAGYVLGQDGFSSLCFSNNHFRSGNFMADLSTSMVLSENGAKTSVVEGGGVQHGMFN